MVEFNPTSTSVSENESIQKQISNFSRRIKELENFEEQHLKIHQEMMAQLKPITDTFANVDGFGKVSIMILKGLALFGAGIGVIYALIQFLRK